MLYTPPVINTPRNIEDQIEQTRRALAAIAQGPLRRQAGYALNTIRLRDERYQRENKDKPGYEAFAVPPLEPTWREVRNQYNARMDEIGDPTSLILIDEADRLRMTSLEQVSGDL